MRVLFLIALLLPYTCLAISPKKIDRITNYYVKKFKLPKIIIRGTTALDYTCLIRSITLIESTYREWKIVHEKNVNDYSYGLMMIRCHTAKEIGLKRECEVLLDPWWNIYYGIKYFNKQLKRYHNDIDKAIAAYNAGRVYICKTGVTQRGKECVIGKFTNQEHVDRFNKAAKSCVVNSLFPEII